MTLDLTHELPTIPDTRWFELRAFWRRRIADYWSLGAVSSTYRFDS